jgi:hypothetical protein
MTTNETSPVQSTTFADAHFAKALAALSIDPAVYAAQRNSRTRSAVDVRCRVWAWMRKHSLMPGVMCSLKEIAQASGGFDHSTVMNGLRRAKG